MGSLLQTLLSKSNVEEVFIDFQRAEPSDKELRVFNLVGDALRDGEVVLQELQDYTGVQDLARQAMADSSKEEECFVQLISRVRAIKHFRDHAARLEMVFPPLLRSLAEPQEDKKQSLEDQQALARQLALVLDYALRFDAVRMMRPQLANDFSYYRRLLQRFKRHPQVEVKEDEANGMGMFTAQHIPMITSLAHAAAETMRENERVTSALACMANSCLQMIQRKKFDDAAINLLCARAMAGSIVLFDHVDPLGAFHKKAPIQLKQCIQSLKKEFPGEPALTNAIRFSSKHFNEAPISITELFD